MIRVANAPVSWGVLEFDLQGERAGHLRVLDEIRDAGYAGTELGDWGYFPTDPEVLSRLLRARELELLAAFVPVELANAGAHAGGEATALRTARLLAEVSSDQPLLVLADDNGKDPIRVRYAGRVQPEHSLQEGQWQVFVAGVHRIARAVREQVGLRTAFHHHCAGYVETPEEVATLLDRTDSALVGLCFDSGHYRFGGGDPLEGLHGHADRIWHVHFKDCDPRVAARARAEGWDYFEALRRGIFCALGEGDVPFPELVAALKEVGYQGWVVVEQDVLPGTGTPFEYARSNREYLRRLGL